MPLMIPYKTYFVIKQQLRFNYMFGKMTFYAHNFHDMKNSSVGFEGRRINSNVVDLNSSWRWFLQDKIHKPQCLTHCLKEFIQTYKTKSKDCSLLISPVFHRSFIASEILNYQNMKYVVDICGVRNSAEIKFDGPVSLYFSGKIT